jgi:YVTN family beta-propeller protein
MKNSPVAYVACCALALGLVLDATQAVAEPSSKQIRRPVSMVATANRLIVANRRSGSLAVVDVSSGTIIAEHSIGKRIEQMVELKTTRDKTGATTVLLLCPDEQQLITATLSDGKIETAVFGEIDSSACRLIVHSQHVYVTEKWARKVISLEITTQSESGTSGRTPSAKRKSKLSRKELNLPFAPQELQILPDGKSLVVADAFGGHVAIINAKEFSLESVAKIKGHNIRGLAVSEDGERLLIAHQRLNPLARADYDDLHWGSLVSNGVRVIDVSEFQISPQSQRGSGEQDPKTAASTKLNNRDTEGWLDHFGGIGNATGDPSGVITGRNDLMAVTLGGIGEVIIRRAGYSTRIAVGRRPEAMAVHGDRLYVANRFDDSVSCIDLTVGKVDRTISLGAAAKLDARDRGELLFFDARVSHDGWMSCHSCHTDGHSSGLLVDTLGDGDYGAPKRVPSLLGTHGTGPWAWNGTMSSLADQVRKSVTTTMHGEELTDQQTADLVAFLESLRSPPPQLVKSKTLQAHGRSVFESNGCSQCHAGTKLTSQGVFDVGLVDEHKNRKFNPPSLRGVSQRSRLFHDGRAINVDDVILKYRHQLRKPLGKKESHALLAYLKSL